MNMNKMNGIPAYKVVMIVDDNEIDLYISENAIKKFGFAQDVVLMNSAIRALEYLKSIADTIERLPELIFLDIRMPEMDGFGFLENYEHLPESIRKKCIIMMLSSSLDEADHNRASGNRYVKRFLNKPLGMNKLKELLEQD